jgi:hypothetical protein
VSEEPAEALDRERLLRDAPAAVLRPELVVDAPVGKERRGREGEREAGERAPKRRALGAVEVEEGVVEVEEDGAEAGQGLVRAARGHLAR